MYVDLFQVDVEQHTLAKYLMELTMLDYDMVHFAPSQIAAGAFCLALKILDNGEWVSSLQTNCKQPLNAPFLPLWPFCFLNRSK